MRLVLLSLLWLGINSLVHAIWLPIQEQDLRIKSDSALDFSKIFEQSAITQPISLDAKGRFTLFGKRQRLFCASMMFTPVQGRFPKHEKSDELARELRLHGYNLVRLLSLDTALMSGKPSDFSYDLQQMDRFLYLLAALKREGIYWMLDLATSPNASFGDVGKKRRLKGKHQLKLSVHYDEQDQQHWQQQVKHIFDQVNPYTKQTILTDPALVAVTLYNELGLAFNTRKHVPIQLKDKFFQWLKQRDDTAELRWPRKKEVSQQSALLQEYLSSLEVQSLDWMTAWVRDLGFKGMITAFNNGKKKQAHGVRSLLDLVSVHGYFAQPKGFIRRGNDQESRSAISQGLPLVRQFVSSRYLGKPFIVDEYDHVYWNAWRYQAPLVAAYAAFQDWDGLCRFNHPVILSYGDSQIIRQQAIHPFGVGLDPIGKVTETLASLLFRRGDVAVAKEAFIVLLTDEQVMGVDSGVKSLPKKLGFIGLLQSLSLSRTKGIDLSKVVNHQRSVYNTPSIEFSAKEGTASIQTRQTEALFFAHQLPRKLDNLSLIDTSEAGLMAVSALDRLSIYDSRHLLMMIATDAKNSGAQFSADRRELLELGHLPVLMQSIKISLSLKNVHAQNMQLYALSLTGERRERLVIHRQDNQVFVELDTAKLKQGISSYFEWVIE